jgi:prevent-host-death family protein
MRKVGSREFKNRVAKYMDEASKGRPLLVTKRGKPLVKVSPPDPESDSEPTLMDVLKRLEMEGKIRLAKGRLGKFRPVKIRGKSASQTLLEDRR